MLPTLRLSLIFEALDPVSIPGFSGSVWRGAFGYALKRVACVMRMRPCEGCPLEASCVYTQLFDSRPMPGEGLFAETKRAPHPFALVPEAECAALEPGEHFALDLILVGRAAAWAPIALRAFADAGERGIGRGRGRLALIEARGCDDTVLWSPGRTLRSPGATLPQIPALPRRVRLAIKTPLRLKRGGRFVHPEEFALSDLVTAVARRVSELCERYGGGSLCRDFRALKEAARQIPIVRRDLAWREYPRYSTRQRQWLSMGGIVGSADIDFGIATGAAEALWPFLIAGAAVGAGKAVTMGFGAYDVIAIEEAVRDAPEPT
ncbi:MAG TPA: CRISPR system precrRNA processing endoribonuclease RAMP protein Cas6 [Stellaceae bacterium]|nr:CRISPR system precrRNA processing endoribonuclease RAMP protein Cas6 [Stellaceae bacterium]